MTLPRIVMWEPAEPGLRAAGLALLAPEGDGYRAEGSVTAVSQGSTRFVPGEPWSMRFTVQVDAGFCTRSAAVEAITRDGCSQIVLRSNGQGIWTVKDRPAPELDGCLDFDLGSTPFTNTLPIRRLGLRIGQTRDVLTAWVSAPGLELRAKSQRYTRIEPQDGLDRYAYESLATGFKSILTVDDEGLVIEYAGVSRRLASR